MTWFKVDDRFHAHPKVLALRSGPCPDASVSLWVLAGSWSAANLTDGKIPAYALPIMCGKSWKKAAAELVRVGLWEPCDDGYSFRSWDEYQPNRAEVEGRRAETRERVTRYRERTRGVGNALQPRISVEGCNADVTPPPSRPVPTRPISPNGESTRAPEPSRHMDAFASSFARQSPTEAMVIRVASETRQAIGGAPYRATSSADKHAVGTVARWAESMPDPEAATRAALAGFWSAKGARGALTWLAEEDPGRYIPTATEAAKPAQDAIADERKRLHAEAVEAQRALSYAPLLDGAKARERNDLAWAALRAHDAKHKGAA